MSVGTSTFPIFKTILRNPLLHGHKCEMAGQPTERQTPPDFAGPTSAPPHKQDSTSDIRCQAQTPHGAVTPQPKTLSKRIPYSTCCRKALQYAQAAPSAPLCQSILRSSERMTGWSRAALPESAPAVMAAAARLSAFPKKLSASQASFSIPPAACWYHCSLRLAHGNLEGAVHVDLHAKDRLCTVLHHHHYTW